MNYYYCTLTGQKVLTYRRITDWFHGISHLTRWDFHGLVVVDKLQKDQRIF